jgi:hypothetical protein
MRNFIRYHRIADLTAVGSVDLWVHGLIAPRRRGLSLLRITGRIIAPIFPADVLSTRLVCWLFLSPLVADDALLR